MYNESVYLSSILKRESRKNRISEIIVSEPGVTPQLIREMLENEGENVSMSMIYQDISDIRKEWKEKRQMSIAVIADHELAIAENLRKKAIESFEISKQSVTQTEHVVKAQYKGGIVMQQAEGLREVPQTEVIEKTVIKHNPAGDVRFLDTAIGASTSIRKMLGIEAEKIVIVDRQERNSNGRGSSLHDLRRLDATELARQHEQALKEADYTE